MGCSVRFKRWVVRFRRCLVDSGSLADSKDGLVGPGGPVGSEDVLVGSGGQVGSEGELVGSGGLVSSEAEAVCVQKMRRGLGRAGGLGRWARGVRPSAPPAPHLPWQEAKGGRGAAVRT